MYFPHLCWCNAHLWRGRLVVVFRGRRMTRKPGAPSPRIYLVNDLISTVLSNGVKLRLVLPLSEVLCLGLIDHSLLRLEGRVTTAIRFDASCVHPQRQENHNIIRSNYRSSFAALVRSGSGFWAQNGARFYLISAFTRDEISRLHARFHQP